jgi:hypothetical protein
MLVHELVAVRGAGQGRKVVELNSHNDNRPEENPDGPRINSTLHVEASVEKLAEMFGRELTLEDINQKFQLTGLSFEPVPEA